LANLKRNKGGVIIMACKGGKKGNGGKGKGGK